MEQTQQPYSNFQKRISEIFVFPLIYHSIRFYNRTVYFHWPDYYEFSYFLFDGRYYQTRIQNSILAKEHNIIMPIISNNLAQITLQDDDIVILLSNLIDNAIEACQKVEADRYIKLKLVRNTNEFILSIQNSIKEESFNTDSVLLTTKSSRSKHGIGLQNVAEIVNKYQGISSITCKDYCFYFSAVFPQDLEE